MNAQPTKSSTYATFSTPKPTQSATVPSTTELYRTLRLIPDSRYYLVTQLLLSVFSDIFAFSRRFCPKWLTISTFVTREKPRHFTVNIIE